MNFFTQQDQARRNTTVLVLLFLSAVLILIILTNILAAFTLWLIDGQVAGGYQAYQEAVDTLSYEKPKGIWAYLSWHRLGLISAAVCGTILCAIVYKWLQLSSGGKAVAESLGGQRINPNTNDANEKRALNVVEEMAIASGMPVPAVYLLSHEQGINAFAAGNSPADAVIGLTQGCIEQFNREQLQGVIAHEFSHILNGDMRLNIRLIAVLNGILFIGLIGSVLLRGNMLGYHSYSRRSRDSRLVMLAIALLAIGWLGKFFGSLIKSAVSRQREFLADASAVQFTRNPQGIADALKIIGGYNAGSKVENPHSSEVSHLFFGQAISKINALFSTHPPLTERIQRIEPHWNGQFISRHGESIQSESQHSSDEAVSAMAGTHTRDNTQRKANPSAHFDANFSDNNSSNSFIKPDATFATEGDISKVTQGLQAISEPLIRRSHDPLGAISLVCALLLSNNSAERKKQLGLIQQTTFKGLSEQVALASQELKNCDRSFYLPLVELTLPALKCMSAQQYLSFNQLLLALIKADNKVELFEWCLFQLIKHYLQADFEKVKPSRARYKKPQQVSHEYQIVLSMLAYQGHNDQQQIIGAFGRGANAAGLYDIALLDKQQCSMETFSAAVNKLANCYPLLKPRLLKGLADCARHDGEIKLIEKEILTSLAAVMDCPMPKLGQSV